MAKIDQDLVLDVIKYNVRMKKKYENFPSLPKAFKKGKDGMYAPVLLDQKKAVQHFNTMLSSYQRRVRNWLNNEKDYADKQRRVASPSIA